MGAFTASTTGQTTATNPQTGTTSNNRFTIDFGDQSDVDVIWDIIYEDENGCVGETTYKVLKRGTQPTECELTADSEVIVYPSNHTYSVVSKKDGVAGQPFAVSIPPTNANVSVSSSYNGYTISEVSDISNISQLRHSMVLTQSGDCNKSVRVYTNHYFFNKGTATTSFDFSSKSIGGGEIYGFPSRLSTGDNTTRIVSWNYSISFSPSSAAFLEIVDEVSQTSPPNLNADPHFFIKKVSDDSGSATITLTQDESGKEIVLNVTNESEEPTFEVKFEIGVDGYRATNITYTSDQNKYVYRRNSNRVEIDSSFKGTMNLTLNVDGCTQEGRERGMIFWVWDDTAPSPLLNGAPSSMVEDGSCRYKYDPNDPNVNYWTTTVYMLDGGRINVTFNVNCGS